MKNMNILLKKSYISYLSPAPLTIELVRGAGAYVPNA